MHSELIMDISSLPERALHTCVHTNDTTFQGMVTITEAGQSARVDLLGLTGGKLAI